MAREGSSRGSGSPAATGRTLRGSTWATHPGSRQTGRGAMTSGSVVRVWAGEAKRARRARGRGSANAAGSVGHAYQLTRWSNTYSCAGAGASSQLAIGSGACSHSGWRIREDAEIPDSRQSSTPASGRHRSVTRGHDFAGQCLSERTLNRTDHAMPGKDESSRVLRGPIGRGQ